MRVAVELAIAGMGRVGGARGGRKTRRWVQCRGRSERGGGAESLDGSDTAEDFARGQVADATQLGKGGLDVGGGLGDSAVQVAYLGDEADGEAAQGFAGGIAGPDSRRRSAA